MGNFVVGTHNSVSSFINEQDWTEEDYVAIKSIRDARFVVEHNAPKSTDRVYITYGFNVLPTSQALGIADILVAAGFTRELWRYV